MKKATIVFFCLAPFITSCSKDDNNTTSPSGGCSQGTIRFSNNSANPYMISIDGIAKGSINGKSFVNVNIDKGFHTLKAEQISGYVLYPTIVNGTTTLAGCDQKEFVFP